jgi:hypothetical protein
VNAAPAQDRACCARTAFFAKAEELPVQVVSRETLYEQVWSRPMMKVAADYGVTGTALKKTCDRHQIPTPERGYWAKLQHGKRVAKEALPKLKEARLAMVRISASPPQPMPSSVLDASAAAREKLAAAPVEITPPSDPDVGDHPALAASRKALTRAKPDHQGFASIQGRGLIAMKIAPASNDRAIAFAGLLLRLAEAQGHARDVTETGLTLVVDGERIAFSLEERSDRTPHTPTEKELKRKADNERWGYGSTTPWPKYDHVPSGRLALLLNMIAYTGLPRAWSDRKHKRLEGCAAEILAACAGHAAMTKANRRKAEEARRQAEIAEARRRREAAYEVRQKRRLEFVDAIDGVMTERAKVARVLAHFESVGETDAGALGAMLSWLRLRLKQLDALLSPTFVEISSRVSEVEFDEAKAAVGLKGDGQYRYYGRPAALDYWSLDRQADRWRRRSATEWAVEAGLLPDVGATPEGQPAAPKGG